MDSHRPVIVAFSGGKGGTGKTTATISCAVDWMVRKKRKVLVVDADPQRSLLTWSAVANEAKRPVPTVVAMGAGLSQPGQLPALAKNHDVTLIDAPGRIDGIVRESLLVADLVIVPCQASAMDVWSLTESLDLVNKARLLRPKLNAALLLNRVQSRTTLTKSVRETLEATGVRLLASTLGDRVAFREAPAAGQGPTTYAPKSPAALEVQALVNEIEGLT